MKHSVKIAPSLLSANFARLEDDIRRCEAAGADLLHVDVMDGHFVPNITIGPLVVEAIRPVTQLPLDVHLMIEKPERYVQQFAQAGADFISVHQETSPHLHRTLMLIRELGVKSGVVLNPATPINTIFDAVECCDFVLLMSVNPGFGGQQFITSFLRRCAALRDFLDTNGFAHVEIEVDGGIKASNAEEVVRAGASMIVSGSGVFGGSVEDNIAAIRQAGERAHSVVV